MWYCLNILQLFDVYIHIISYSYMNKKVLMWSQISTVRFHTLPQLRWESLMQCCSFHHDLIMISRCITMYWIVCIAFCEAMGYPALRITFTTKDWSSRSEKYPSWERTFQSWTSLSSLEDNTSDQNKQGRYNASWVLGIECQDLTN